MEASADELEVRGLLHNGQTGVPLHITIHGLGFTQPPTIDGNYQVITLF